MTGPHQLTALAHLTALIEAVRWLADASTAAALPGHRRQSTAVRSTQATARFGALLTREKTERATLGGTPGGAHPMPISPALLDAQTTAHRAVVDSAWITASALRTTPTRYAATTTGYISPVWWPHTRLHTPPWDAATTHLRITLHHTPDQAARDVAAILAAADHQVRAVAGCGPAWTPIPGQPCPRCTLSPRHMEAEVSSTDERQWTIRCREGQLTMTAEDYGRQHSRLADLLALIRSVRRQHQKRTRGRIAA